MSEPSARKAADAAWERAGGTLGRDDLRAAVAASIRTALEEVFERLRRSESRSYRANERLDALESQATPPADTGQDRAVVGEPVAWRWRLASWRDDEWNVTERRDDWPSEAIVEPLYLTPQAPSVTRDEAITAYRLTRQILDSLDEIEAEAKEALADNDDHGSHVIPWAVPWADGMRDAASRVKEAVTTAPAEPRAENAEARPHAGDRASHPTHEGVGGVEHPLRKHPKDNAAPPKAKQEAPAPGEPLDLDTPLDAGAKREEDDRAREMARIHKIATSPEFQAKLDETLKQVREELRPLTDPLERGRPTAEDYATRIRSAPGDAVADPDNTLGKGHWTAEGFVWDVVPEPPGERCECPTIFQEPGAQHLTTCSRFREPITTAEVTKAFAAFAPPEPAPDTDMQKATVSAPDLLQSERWLSHVTNSPTPSLRDGAAHTLTVIRDLRSENARLAAENVEILRQFRQMGATNHELRTENARLASQLGAYRSTIDAMKEDMSAALCDGWFGREHARHPDVWPGAPKTHVERFHAWWAARKEGKP